jgi:hypothetical protein
MTTQPERISTSDAAGIIGLSKQRVCAKIAAGHYSGVSRCECGLTTMIPVAEVLRDLGAGTITRRRIKR